MKERKVKTGEIVTRKAARIKEKHFKDLETRKRQLEREARSEAIKIRNEAMENLKARIFAAASDGKSEAVVMGMADPKTIKGVPDLDSYYDWSKLPVEMAFKMASDSCEKKGYHTHIYIQATINFKIYEVRELVVKW